MTTNDNLKAQRPTTKQLVKMDTPDDLVEERTNDSMTVVLMTANDNLKNTKTC